MDVKHHVYLLLQPPVHNLQVRRQSADTGARPAGPALLQVRVELLLLVAAAPFHLPPASALRVAVAAAVGVVEAVCLPSARRLRHLQGARLGGAWDALALVCVPVVVGVTAFDGGLSRGRRKEQPL